ncbi:MAG: AbrB/MazE/SpoVT family DNA-binding domain-containing protein [Candidatus Diapherotrites archaeon]|nr:AbrB/MazE/SpoVT family DNA-binding domain-containing protein [Candidatus Diapherotrites archaeon]
MKKKEGLGCLCGKVAKPTKLKFKRYVLDGWKCDNCGEEYLDPLQAERILVANKLKHQKFHAKLGRIKSNLIVRIPKVMEQALGLKQGEKVTLKIKGKSIEITP